MKHAPVTHLPRRAPTADAERALGPFGSQVEGHIYKSMTKSGTASREELAALVREHKSRTHERACV